MQNTLQFIGHSAFYIKTKTSGILIDPFISQNPKANFDFSNIISDILVTHGHADHLGDAISISKQTGCCVTAVFELANYCAQKGGVAKGVNIGGKIQYGWGFARFLPAFHSSSTPTGEYAGMPASILLEIDGVKIYHAGDTSLNSEMKVVGELYKPDIALLPIGSCFTMDMDEALVAAKWLGAKKVIPMHYNTFDAISVDVSVFKEKAQKLGVDVLILNPSEQIEF